MCSLVQEKSKKGTNTSTSSSSSSSTPTKKEVSTIGKASLLLNTYAEAGTVRHETLTLIGTKEKKTKLAVKKVKPSQATLNSSWPNTWEWSRNFNRVSDLPFFFFFFFFDFRSKLNVSGWSWMIKSWQRKVRCLTLPTTLLPMRLWNWMERSMFCSLPKITLKRMPACPMRFILHHTTWLMVAIECIQGWSLLVCLNWRPPFDMMSSSGSEFESRVSRRGQW